ncbi:serine/threonine-protein kinase [Phytohabitans kaempferiae]|uniref:Serine/threonine-protein kinase n=1 Tax=Phytohabitans kaempferiae TaxID=1620943 RepID=A0ABV6M4N5_9ACTN
MSGDQGSRAAPLRKGDPRKLGRYELVGRLGEGGMGVVYLARTADGRQVAIKMIRADLEVDEEFRRRFRSEVNRARQVPPFCTAEVLDADPGHERPYLVVEYVDGPSLSTVVAERGPLTPANLHALAIGMATALTAIHGAGVIHRDLKPSNVLLPPGSPKVIDFGIARTVEATSQHTATNQWLGTVAYMAPERFSENASTVITPAADVFAWGAVLAYAGTGRTPFAADSPPVVAARILTQPPDLTGLVPPLRDLVERTLAKSPADRPTARALLDLLLAAGPDRPPAVAAALAQQPGLLVAAAEAQAATEQQPERANTAAAVPPELGTASAGATEVFPSDQATAPAAPAVAAAGGSPPPPAVPVPMSPIPAPPAPPAVKGGSRWGRFANVALALAVLVTSLTVAGIASGVLPFEGDDGGGTPSGTGPSATAGTATSAPSTATPRASDVVVRDPLTGPLLWEVRDDDVQLTTCEFDGALVITRNKQGPYRCPGPMDQLTDFSMAVDVRLRSEGACAALWFRFVAAAGYIVRVCPEGFYVGTHGVGDGSTVRVLRTMPFAPPIAVGATTRVTVSMQGATITLERDGQVVGTVRDTTFQEGRVVLGIYPETPDHEPPFTVAFSNVEVRAFRG